MSNRYYVISVNSGARAVPNDAIEGVLDLHAADWLRFSNNTYYVFTWLEARPLYEQIKLSLHAEDFVLIAEANVATMYGWGPQVVVDWFAKVRA